MAEKVETVSLIKRHGQYELNLDKAEAQLSKLNAEREKLVDKARIIEQARQKKHLMDEQARVLGSAGRVKLKDLLIFLPHSVPHHHPGGRPARRRGHRRRRRGQGGSGGGEDKPDRRSQRGRRVRAGERPHCR